MSTFPPESQSPDRGNTLHAPNILSAFEQFFTEEDFIFLRSANAITLHSDHGLIFVASKIGKPAAALVTFVIAPPTMDLTQEEVMNIVAHAAATHEVAMEFIIVDRPGKPLVILAEVRVDLILDRDELARRFSDFSVCTDVAIGDAQRRALPVDPLREIGEFEEHIGRLRY